MTARNRRVKGGIALIAYLLYCFYMPYKDGTWGEQAKKRMRKRNEYFRIYRKTRALKKSKARAKLNAAVQRGKIKPLPCESFNNHCKGRIEAHHTDYKKPLEVVWLCAFHHREAHNKLNTKKIECQNCGIAIFAPKKKYCSGRCNTADWRRGQ